MNNAIFVIKPFKWHGMWVFDDERVGLDKEPFVAGADTMIDTAVRLKGIPNADDGFLFRDPKRDPGNGSWLRPALHGAADPPGKILPQIVTINGFVSR